MSSASQNTSARKPYYILRHRVTKKPMVLRNSGKGYTCSDPDDEGIPRLFTTPKGANMARQNWARGQMWLTKQGELKITKVANRAVGDWNIEELII